MDKFTGHIFGIPRVLNRLQRKHRNARYNQKSFEETNSLCVSVADNAGQIYVMTSLFAQETPDVNYGISDIYYSVMGKSGVQGGKLPHREFICRVNDAVCGLDTGISGQENIFVPVDISLDIKLEVGDMVCVFINFYYFLDRNDDETKDIPLKITKYMARFVHDLHGIPKSHLERVCTRNTRYFSKSTHSIAQAF